MSDLTFTGERFIPGTSGELAYEHWHRYAFARRFTERKRVLDAACGEGYGTALLSAVAHQAIGVDIDEGAVTHARARYADHANLRFECSSVTRLPLADASVDVVVSFETIEHIAASDQPLMLAEFARVLAPGGFVVISSPNKRRYTEELDYHNPFHLHELYRDELQALLDVHFPHRRWFQQTRSHTSALWSDEFNGEDARCEVLIQDADTIAPAHAPEGLYYVVVAAASADALPAHAPQLSLFADREDSQQKQVEHQFRETMRLDALLKDRDAAADRQTLHIRHLEELVAYRERIVEERDTQLVALNASHDATRGEVVALRKAHHALQAEHRSLQSALAAQEHIISHRQTLNWWLQLPWLRAKLSWQQWRGQ